MINSPKLAQVLSVSLSPVYGFHKNKALVIQLLAGCGVAGDAHCGKTVKHRSRVRVDPSQANLRQVHLIQSELFNELKEKNFEVAAGDLGENITTQGIDLLQLPKGSRLRLGREAEIEITGLRNPCKQLDDYKSGLMSALLDRDRQGHLLRKAGVMAIVLKSGSVAAGDEIRLTLPPQPHLALKPV